MFAEGTRKGTNYLKGKDVKCALCGPRAFSLESYTFPCFSALTLQQSASCGGPTTCTGNTTITKKTWTLPFKEPALEVTESSRLQPPMMLEAGSHGQQTLRWRLY